MVRIARPKETLTSAQLPHEHKNKSYLRGLVVVLLIVSFIGGIYWISNEFQVANINIKAKHQSLTLNNKQFIALKNTGASAQINNPITFELMIVSDQENENVVFTESSNVSLKAKGIITLYNEYSAQPIKLPMHAFLSDTGGKAYLTDKAVSIPGYAKSAGKIIPGKTLASITAFLAGDSYNGSPSDFNVSSFKGTPKYSKIYGKIQTALAGGAQGEVYKTDFSIESNLSIIANSSFKDNLIKKVNAEIPAGYFLYPSAVRFAYSIDDNILSKTPDASVKISGTLSAILLKENDLSAVLIKNLFPDVSADELKEITISNVPGLSFSFADPNQLIGKDTQSLPFTLTGNIEALWQPDITAIKSNLMGVSKDSIQSIFKQDPGIDSASIKIFPPWQSYLPDDTSRIKIYTQ
jgi:hypothetical protein